jgi:hypothetical protein
MCLQIDKSLERKIRDCSSGLGISRIHCRHFGASNVCIIESLLILCDPRPERL